MSTKKGGGPSDIVSYSDLIERLQKSNNRILDLNEQLQQAKSMASINVIEVMPFKNKNANNITQSMMICLLIWRN